MDVRAILGALVHTGAGFEPDMAVLVEGDRIAHVVPRTEVPAAIDLDNWGDVAIVPGTVNAHGHAFQNLLKGFADDLSFDRWRDDVLYPFSDRLDGDAIYTGALFAFAEALLAGATTTVDFFYLHDASNENAERVIEAAHDIGIRLVMARALYDPDAPTRAPTRYREPGGRGGRTLSCSVIRALGRPDGQRPTSSSLAPRSHPRDDPRSRWNSPATSTSHVISTSPRLRTSTLRSRSGSARPRSACCTVRACSMSVS